MDREFYAHSVPGKLLEDWQRLEEHLKNVAETARGFTDAFGAGEWAYLAGLARWGNTLISFSPTLEAHSDANPDIENENIRPDHSTTGVRCRGSQ